MAKHGLPLDPQSFRWKPSTEPAPDSPTFEELHAWARLKRQIKGRRRPRGRKALAQWVHEQIKKAGLGE